MAIAIIGVGFMAAGPVGAAERVDNTTLTGKMIMGYQGWFGCPGDTAGRGWVHWKSGDQWTVDMLPDVSELTPDERCDTGLKTADGKPVYVFSSQNPQTVDRHFKWMEDYGLDGVALQQFAARLLDVEKRRNSDVVLDNVVHGAERHGRVFFLMYDLSGISPEKLDVVLDDWLRLNERGLTQGPAYLQHRGHPLLGLWGLGLAGRDLPPEEVGALLDRLRQSSKAFGGVTIVGGVSADWRAGLKVDPGWKAIWRKLDVISPWTVGRFANMAGADTYRTTMLVQDLAYAKEMGVDYMPVVFPGFSWSNLMLARRDRAKAIVNQIPRQCGDFYWRQVYNGVLSGVSMMYTAMFDEVDEGTAIFKLSLPFSRKDLPGATFPDLSEVGCNVSSDWYLRLASQATRLLRGKLDLDVRLPILDGPNSK